MNHLRSCKGAPAPSPPLVDLPWNCLLTVSPQTRTCACSHRSSPPTYVVLRTDLPSSLSRLAFRPLADSFFSRSQLAQKDTLRNASSESNYAALCRSLSSDVETPWVRAMFAFLATSDWRELVDEMGLPLKDRVAVALRCVLVACPPSRELGELTEPMSARRFLSDSEVRSSSLAPLNSSPKPLC